MPTFGELLTELDQAGQAFQAELEAGGPPPADGPVDRVRRRYMARVAELSGRAVIYYGTAWYERRPMDPQATAVEGGDIRGFMEACSNLAQRELDLIIHSPGGDPDAAEAIMAYLRERFDHIRAIVPLAAMSAATMMALACDEIVMGAHSQLGPIDPQITVPTAEGPRQAPAQAILDQFQQAQDECATDPAKVAAWMPLLRTIGPGLLAYCKTAQARTEEFVARELERHMFIDLPEGEREAAARAAAGWFSNHKHFKSHGRNVSRHDARDQGIKVADLEDDPEFQDAVLSVSHATQLTFGQTPCTKLIENHTPRCWMQLQAPPMLFNGPAPSGGAVLLG